MQHRRAFALRDSLDVETFGGSLAMPDGSTFRVDDALKDTGVIVTDDPQLISALSSYIAVKAVPVPKEHSGYEGLSVDELDGEISSRGLSVPDNAKKGDKVSALVADDLHRLEAETRSDAAAAEASVVNAKEGE